MSSKPDLLSEVTFGSFLQYSPRGTSDTSRKSRLWCDAVKFDRPGKLRLVIEALPRRGTRELLHLLGKDALLVPVPRSAPLQRGALWPGLRICEELLRVGLGGEMRPCIERVKAIQKSAFARQGERPAPEVHLKSMVIHEELHSKARIVIVDDVVTLGATLLAAASLVNAAWPRSSVLAFALVRTMGLVPEVDSVLAPCVGRIRLASGGKAWREP